MSALRVRAQPLGDSAVTLVFGTERSAELLLRVHATARALESARIPHVEDVVPAYLAVTVFYDALHTTYEEVSAGGTGHIEAVRVVYDAAESCAEAAYQ